VNRAAKQFGRISVTELMQRLDEWIDQPHQHQILGRQHLVGEIVAELGPMHQSKHQRRDHRSDP
jgi:hypothetical protein